MWLSHDGQGTEYQKHYRTWFHFRVSQVSQTCLTTFHINNMNNQSTLFKYGMHPVYKTTGMQEYERLPEKSVFKHNEGNEHELTFRHRLSEGGETFFAFTYPWSYEQNQSLLDQLQERSKAFPGLFFQRELLTHSLEKRRVELLTITSQRGVSSALEKGLKQLLPEG